MAFFNQRDVLIACTCNSLRPLTKLYFCRHCIVLRCGYCVSHEVDSIYCSNCLVNLASSEAKLKKNRCGACFDCPNCFHTLTIRAATVSKINPSGEAGTTPSKTSVKNYYLACFFCRWTSRDARIPDQATATSSNWPEHENPHSNRINALLEYFKVITLRERMEKENKMFLHTSRRNYQHFSEKLGLTAMLARKRAGLPPLNLGRDDSNMPPQVTPAEATEDVEPLPEDVFTKPVDVVSLTSLLQRYSIPDLQPEYISDLFPVHKQLFIKRSQRCRTCLHNIFKPEYGPASIKFKIHLAAYYYVPEIRLKEKLQLVKGKQTDLVLKIINPAQIPTTVQFLQLDQISETVNELQREDRSKKEAETPEKKSITGLVPIQKKLFPPEKQRVLDICPNAEIVIPEVTIGLPPRDDTAEYDDNSDPTQYHDNPAIIVWRKGNRVEVKFSVAPRDDLEVGTEVIVGFVLRFTYHDKIISPLEQKEGKDVNVDVRYFLNIGSIAE